MREKLKEALDRIINDKLVSAVISNKRNKENEVDKIKVRPVIIKDELLYQVSSFVGPKVLHSNVTIEELKVTLEEDLFVNFSQGQFLGQEEDANILVSKKGQVTVKYKKHSLTEKEPLAHNRKKTYLIEEGTKADFLVELGVMNNDGLVHKNKYDKFRQINRFLEFIDDIIPNLEKDKQIRILDFGCGKSYLTFAMYYYFKKVKNIDVAITGLDLKTDVIRDCNALAKKLKYDNLEFLNGDIADYDGESKVDMVVTLHACDTATDYALYKAVKWNARVILSVPCCQHEINKQIKNQLLNPALKYGIIKERMSALLTDAIRAEALSQVGYDAQILEFIDMEHTPKNILIRAVKKDKIVSAKKCEQQKEQLETLIQELNLSPKIKELLNNE
ncbi:MAG: SAM-dependent methyltransferase [Lachnospiraceae bacterium]|nr:SAM-dependent methyltransferase [Lachnospiraceae bacterium]